MVGEPRHVEPVAVDRDRHRSQTGVGDGRTVKSEARVFDRDRIDSPGPQRATEQHHPLSQAGGDHHLVGRCRDAPHAGYVIGQRIAQPHRPQRPRVTELPVRETVEGRAVVAQPFGAGEERGIRQS
jgi:hypothetical protein